MKKIITIAIAACAAATLFAEAPATNVVAKGGMRAKTGGSILRPVPEGSKAIVFLDSLDDEKGADAFAAYVKRFSSMTSLYTKTIKESVGTYQNKAGDVVIALVSKGDLAIMPAKKMAVVPVASDDAATGRDLWKATVAVFSLMGEAPNDFSGTALIRSAAESMGIPMAQKVFYKKALEEGWAPEPADEFQKKLWDEHQAKKAEKAAEAPAAK